MNPTYPQGKRAASPRPDVAIARIARRQHGLITIHQLLDAGLSHSSVHKRVAAGRLHLIHRCIYAVGHEALSIQARWHAAVLAAGDGAALGYLAAASHWNVWRRNVPGIDVVTARRRNDFDGVRVHVSRTLLPRDVRRRNGIPVTSVARTIVDLGDVLTPYQLANVVHEAEFRNRFDERALVRLLARSRGRRAVTIVRQALALRATGSAGTMSELEDAFLAALRAARAPDPRVNVPIDVGDGGCVRPDAHWPAIRLVVEVDGSPHRRDHTREQDRGRDARLRAAGWEVRRCGSGEFDACAADVARRFAAR